MGSRATACNAGHGLGPVGSGKDSLYMGNGLHHSVSPHAVKSSQSMGHDTLGKQQLTKRKAWYLPELWVHRGRVLFYSFFRIGVQPVNSVFWWTAGTQLYILLQDPISNPRELKQDGLAINSGDLIC